MGFKHGGLELWGFVGGGVGPRGQRRMFRFGRWPNCKCLQAGWVVWHISTLFRLFSVFEHGTEGYWQVSLDVCTTCKKI